MNVSSMALNWFLTMFVTSLPLESTLRVWDVLFFDCCSSVLFRCSLALVDIYAQVPPPPPPTHTHHSVLPACFAQQCAPPATDTRWL